MKRLYKFLFGLHAFVGAGAIFGGLAAILKPEEPFGMSVEVLKNSPFNDFLIPGIILFTVIGLGNAISALAIRFKSRFQGYISSIFSGALVIWILVQCIMINSVHFLHVLFFIIGAIEGILSIKVIFEQRLFPANIAIDFYKKISKEM
jgi:hypothetical protein